MMTHGFTSNQMFQPSFVQNSRLKKLEVIIDMCLCFQSVQLRKKVKAYVRDCAPDSHKLCGISTCMWNPIREHASGSPVPVAEP